jgi:rhamnose utilization protein RhaD (predicted bifunctional aldolase and dehydrogenase)
VHKVRRPSELDELAAFSAHIGRDPLLIQGSVGNTSIKIDDTLWVKASGKWLANALAENIFLPLNLSQLRNFARQHHVLTRTVTSLSNEELIPSIETAMHAVLPHRVVVHVHSVNTLAGAVRSDARDRLESQLSGLRWQWVPYTRSGLSLAREIEGVLRRSSAFDILVLGNHGLVVCGDDCRSVECLLQQVELRMSSIPRLAPEFDGQFLRRLVNESDWRLPENTRVHSLATDKISRSILAQGSLYPCQSLILGGADGWRQFSSRRLCVVNRNAGNGSFSKPFLILKDKGVLLSNEITSMQLETLIGLAEVVQRIEMTAPIRYLSNAECDELACLNAYHSRRKTDDIPLSA